MGAEMNNVHPVFAQALAPFAPPVVTEKHEQSGSGGVYGSAMTYARRYALAAIAGLYQDDDDGNAASGVPEVKHKPAKTQPTGLTAGTKADYLSQMDAAADLDELRAATSAAMAAAKAAGDTNAHNEFKNAGMVKAQKFEGANA